MRPHRAIVSAVALAVSLAGPPLSAQRRELSVLIGGNLTGASGPELIKSQSRVGFLGGLSLRLPRGPRVSFQVDLLLVQHRLQGERAPSSLPPAAAGPAADAANLLYAQVPFLLRFQRGYSTEQPVRPFLLLGGYLGIRVLCRRDVTDTGGTTFRTNCSTNTQSTQAGADPFVPPIYQGLDVGLLGGFGVEVRRFAMSVRAERSFTNLVNGGALPTSPFDQAKTWTALVAVEYMLRVL